MVDWAQVGLGVAGSGLVLFILNTALADYNQPNLSIDIQNRSDSINTPKYHEVRYDTILKNIGMQKATNVRLTMHYPSGNITNYRIVFSSENATFDNIINPDTLILNVKRLSPYGVVFVYTGVTDLKAPTFKKIDTVSYNGNYTFYNRTYFVSASYDQGGNPAKRTDLTFTAYKGLQKAAPFSTILMTGASVVLVIIVAVLVLTRRKWNENIMIPLGIGLLVGGPILILSIAHHYYPTLF
jgi:hypothetical protein